MTTFHNFPGVQRVLPSSAGTLNQPVLQTLPGAPIFPAVYSAAEHRFNLAMEDMMGMVEEGQRRANKKENI